MGNTVTLVLSYRINKEHSQKKENKENKEKENICKYLYGKYSFKDGKDNCSTLPIL